MAKGVVDRMAAALPWMVGGLVALTLCLATPTTAANLLRVVKGKSRVLQHDEKIKAVSVADNEVADVVSITPMDLVIIGKSVGITSLVVWGESGAYVEYEIEVDRNVTDKQIVLEVQVAEVNRTALEEYGFDFLMLDHDDGLASHEQKVASYAGAVTSPDPLTDNLSAQEGVSAVFRWIGNKQEVSTAIRALQKNGTLRLLANPRIVSFSGEEASFHVGGEFPVPIAQTGTATGTPTFTIEWKEYGVRLKFTPIIVDTNLINLEVSPEVSSLDWANSVQFAGSSIPSLRTRKVEAIVELNSEQSLVLGGLLSTETFESVSRLPILGHIPLLGFFFTREEMTATETELLIVVSPRIIESVADEVIPPLPGKDERKQSTTSPG